MFDPTGLDGEYFQIPYTPKQDYFDVFSGSWWLSPLKAFANIGVFAGNSFVDITNTLTGGVNLILYAGQNPNWNYELMDTIAYGPGKLTDEIVYYFQNTSPEQIIGDLKDSLTDPATYERALANFVIMWVGYKSSVIKNQGNGLEGKHFDFDEVDDFVKESYDKLSAEGKKIVGEYVDDAGNVWSKNPFQRGVDIENALGHNLPRNFPTIDKFNNGLATSIKSLNLNAKSYQSLLTLQRTVTGYIDDVAGFSGRSWAGVTIRSGDITGRALDLVIPGAGSSGQMSVLNNLVQYGASNGVTVNIIPFP